MALSNSNQNQYSKRNRKPSTVNLTVVSLGVVGSLFLLQSVTVSTVGAAPSSAVADPAVAVEVTPVANAVHDGLKTTSHGDLFGDDNSGFSVELAQSTASEQNASDDNSLLLRRTRELMSKDSREVDSVAARLKEIIRARYDADTLNFETMSKVDGLRKQVAQFESLLARANAQTDALSTEKLALQEQLNLLLSERQNAQSEINDLANQMETQLGSVQALKSETESSRQLLAEKERALDELTNRLNALLAEKQEAEDQSESLNSMLADNKQQLQGLQGELANTIAQRDDATENAAANAANLAEKESSLADLQNLYDSLVSDNEAAKQQQLMLSNELGEKENAFARLVGELQDVSAQRDSAMGSGTELQALVDQKESSIADIQQQVTQLASERDAANSEIVAVNEMLNQKADQIDDLQVKLNQLSNQKDSVADQLSLMQSKFEEVDALAGNMQQERDDLAGTLGLLESKATDVNSAFISEKQNHAKTRAVADALEKDIGKLQQEVVTLTTERDDLLSEKNHLIATSDDISGRLSGSEQELDTRQRELQAALTSISNLNGQISGLTHERETGRATIANLEGEIASVQSELARTKEEAQVQFLANNNDFEDQRALLTAELADRDLKIGNLRDGLAGLEVELQKNKTDWGDDVTARDKQISALKAEVDDLDGKRLRMTGLKTQGDQKLGELRAEIAGLVARRDISNDKLKELKALNRKLTADLDETSKKLNVVTREGAEQLALLKKEISTLDSDAVTAEQEIKKLDSLNTNLNARLSETRKELESVTDEGAQRVMALQTRIGEFEQLNADLTSDNAAANDQINSLEHIKHSLQSELEVAETENLASLAELEKLQANLSGYESELTIANRKLMELETAQRLAEQERDAVIAEAESLRVSLTNELNTAKLGNMSVQRARADNSIPIRLGNADFFAPGSAKLTKAGGDKLTKLAEIIESYDNRRIVVEGHTDNVPIGVGLKYRFESNWELSVARSAAAVRHMQFQTNIDPRNLSAAGYGEFHPVAPNDNPDGRQKNRRVEVVLYPVAETKTLLTGIDE